MGCDGEFSKGKHVFVGNPSGHKVAGIFHTTLFNKEGKLVLPDLKREKDGHVVKNAEKERNQFKPKIKSLLKYGLLFFSSLSV